MNKSLCEVFVTQNGKHYFMGWLLFHNFFSSCHCQKYTYQKSKKAKITGLILPDYWASESQGKRCQF